MNKLLILTSFLFIFIMKINAYEYLIYDRPQGRPESYERYQFLIDREGKIYDHFIYDNGNPDRFNLINDFNSRGIFYYINQSTTRYNGYVIRDVFDNYYKNDLIFLNSLYSQITQSFLNYLYNPNVSQSNYINYENYELLYNSEGLAVESIVNGVWRGLYSSSDKSGYLYDKQGNLAYINGVEPSFFEKLSNKFLKPYKTNLQNIFIKKIWYSLLVFIFAVVILRTVIRMAFQAFLIRFYDNKIQRLEKRREKIENA